MYGYGCPICSGKGKVTNDSFIERARLVHGDKYDYSKVEYKSNSTKICIICSIHGEFSQKPYVHLQGCGWTYCRWKS